MESQPQHPEFRNNPENFHPCYNDATATGTITKFILKNNINWASLFI